MIHSISKHNQYLYLSLGILAILLVWLFASIIVNNPIILPKISETFKALSDLLSQITTYKTILYTFIRVLIAIALGLIIGITLGVLSALHPWLYHFLTPLIKIMRVLPVASIILILLIMFGQNGFNDITFAPIIVALLLIIPIVFEGVYRGITSVDQDLIDVARLDASNNWSLIFNSYLPLVRKEIETALYQSIGLGIKVMVMAEYISQTQTSIGKALLDAKTFLEYDYVFAWTFILIVLCILIELIPQFVKYLRDKKEAKEAKEYMDVQ